MLVFSISAVLPGKNVTLVGAEGKVFVDNINNYAPIIDELGTENC